ncbi:hypothetical protein KFZ19_28555, partial [Salmonella enterica subsp. enterica serovar Typhimurium]|nr:hypothetical protein [Salmonella enterica subsp. enterica serovar Typhimurium]
MEMVFVWKQNYILVDEYFFFCCTWIVNSAENNIFGLDIDDRAAQLSGFALLMMARQDDRRIFTRDVRLNIV